MNSNVTLTDVDRARAFVMRGLRQIPDGTRMYEESVVESIVISKVEKALNDAADEQERLANGPRALGNKAVAFKRLLFADWLRERALVVRGATTDTGNQA